MRRGRICDSQAAAEISYPCKLADDVQRAIQAVQLAAGREVLPAEEETDEIGGRDRFDFAAQPADGQAVNARQHAAVAPLDFAGRGIRA